jgi:hypothetical protein
MTTPTTNTAQAARPLLAVLDDTPDTVNAILDEAHRAPGGLPGLLWAMTSAVLEILIGTAGEDGARKTLDMVLLDVSMTDGNASELRNRAAVLGITQDSLRALRIRESGTSSRATHWPRCAASRPTIATSSRPTRRNSYWEPAGWLPSITARGTHDICTEARYR